ncbi:MAG: hypothetical protein GXP01_06515 [Alphaproteobacteria bacterium]|nr:hypothetical protein [Alphaproteobacteria bacterium]
MWALAPELGGVSNRLTSALGRRDQRPNIELGQAVGATITNADRTMLVEILKPRRQAISCPARKKRIDKLLNRLGAR